MRRNWKLIKEPVFLFFAGEMGTTCRKAYFKADGGTDTTQMAKERRDRRSRALNPSRSDDGRGGGGKDSRRRLKPFLQRPIALKSRLGEAGGCKPSSSDPSRVNNK